MSRNLEVICSAVRLVAVAAAFFDLFMRASCLMFLKSILELFLLVMHGVVTLIPPIIPDSEEKLAVVLEHLQVLFVFGLLVALLPSLHVPSEEHNLQEKVKMELVRYEKLQFPLDLHHRRPR